MERFVFKFFCLFYVAMVVNTRSLYNIPHSRGKIGKLHQHTTDGKRREETGSSILEITQILANVTDRINSLKKQYSADTEFLINAPVNKEHKTIYEHITHKTTTKNYEPVTEDEFIGTAQIEELLNDIKARAIQMVAEQNPTVVDIISSTVTEATFEADPVLTHLQISSPGYALATFVCLNDLENIDKRTANVSNTTADKYSKHSVTVRSAKEEVYTIAHNVEERLQKELKDIYYKVKHKVSKDLNKEIKHVKKVVTKAPTKIMDKITQKVKNVITTKVKTTAHAVNGSRQNRGFISTKKLKTSSHVEHTTEAVTVDDFALLTLYEQILAKTHEDNVMKMLMTNKKRKVDGTIRLSKRNPETLADLTLKEDIKRIYDDEENIPDVDYNIEVNSSEANDDKYSSTTKAAELRETTSVPSDTSYEGLLDKISFKDYVNGFKNYLHFQRDEAKQNFSALVRYQAHKHHNVDDIGKYILNKIPQVPNRKKRYFFDDSDMDEQDISTKSDDSWFKKHFYMFIDKAPPRKYHNSETVEFKGATEAYTADYDDIEKPDLPIQTTATTEVEKMNLETNEGLEDANLDELSEILEHRKTAISSILPFNKYEDFDTTTDMTQNRVDEGEKYENNSPNIISKIFGKQRHQNVNPGNQNYEDQASRYDDDDFLFSTNLSRFQRAAEKEVKGEKEAEKHTTLLNKQETLKSSKTKASNAKVGCVSIVTQPTAVVNLYKDVKTNKIEKLLSKLHFHRKSKKKKDKRHCTRVQRFNPLKKLMDIFKQKQEAINSDSDSAQADYEMITVHIDAFKPVKYDKIPSIEDLKNQVPNISGPLIPEFAQGKVMDQPANDWSRGYGYSTKMEKMFNDAQPKITTSFTPNQHYFKPTNFKKTTPKKTANNVKFKDSTVVSDNIMSVHVKTGNKGKDIFTISPVTLGAILHEIDKIQMKMARVYNYSKDTQTTKKLQGFNDNISLDDDREFDSDITIKGKITRVAKYPVYELIKFNSTAINPVGDNPKACEFAEDDVGILKEIVVETSTEQPYPTDVKTDKVNIDNVKMDKVETDKTKTDKVKMSKVKMDKVTMDKVRMDKVKMDKVKINKINSDATGSLIEMTMKAIENTKQDNLNYKYPDYFHDLVMWNNDILNCDQASNPSWQEILKNIQSDDVYTTPNMRSLQKELYEIKDYLNTDHNYSRQSEEDVNMRKIVDNITNIMTTQRTVTIGDDKTTMKNAMKPATLNFGVTSSYRLRHAEPQDVSNSLINMYLKHLEDVTKYGKGINKVTPSTKGSRSKYKGHHPTAIVNKQPKQFFSTPLPMNNELFEKFLKENHLDVASLKVPVNELHSIGEEWQKKITSLNTNLNAAQLTRTIIPKPVKEQTDKKETTVKVVDKPHKENKDDDMNAFDNSYPENQIEYLNDLEQDLLDDYTLHFDTRNKRSTYQEPNAIAKGFRETRERATDAAFLGKEDIQNFKNKLNDYFITKPTERTGSTTFNTSSYHDDDVEITIINLDDIDNKMDSTKNPFKMLDRENTQNAFTKTVYTPKPLISKAKNGPGKEVVLHARNPAYKDVLSPYVQHLRHKSPHEVITTLDLMQVPMGLGRKFVDKEGNLPKRVLITSDSYKYDVEYHTPNVPCPLPFPAEITTKKWVDTEENDIDVSTAYSLNTEKNDEVRKSLNSEMERMTRDNKKRVERTANTTSKRRTFSQTLHFTKQWTQLRRKRLPKLLPLIKKIFAVSDPKSNGTTKANETAEAKVTTKAYETTKAKATVKVKKKASKENSTESTNGKANAKDTTTAQKRGERYKDFMYNSSYDMYDFKDGTPDDKEIDGQGLDMFTNMTATTDHSLPKNNNTHSLKDSNYVESPHYNVVDEYPVSPDKENHVEVKKNKTMSYIKTLVNTTKVPSTNENGKIDDKVSKKANKLDKRDANDETYTAKDVAALEVIVDLMKNTLSYAEKSPEKITNNVLLTNTSNKSGNNDKVGHTTNSIQVHIAIPYDLTDKKRNAESPKVRKVFSAKLATPVDLEYQIHSIEDNTATTLCPSDYGLSPGTYVVVDDTKRGSFALKPIDIPAVDMRKVIEVTKQLQDETKKDKMKLSKEFVAAVNRHLVQLYENISAANDIDVRLKKPKVRRETRLSKLKKFFGHDRVCDCKCKPNKTMCNVCAASDKVIQELTFEFDNLAKYMSDHCTEIQTFFWMNPRGGRMLRDSVRKIDNSLSDYFKRVKGKCNGNTCKTFVTYIDKRGLDKNKRCELNDIAETLLNHTQTLCNDFDVLAKYIPYNSTLKKKGDEFVNIASNCTASKPVSKRKDINNKRKSYDKDVYTLDNISVNIICNPDNTPSDSVTRPMHTIYNNRINTPSKNILLDYDQNKRNCNKYKKLFSRRRKIKLKKLFPYVTNETVVKDKREATHDQVESPLIADTGGTFWRDYLSKGTRDVNNDSKTPNFKVSIIQTNDLNGPVTIATARVPFRNIVRNICRNKLRNTATVKNEIETSDLLSYNMNELFKLIGTISTNDLKDMKSYADPTIVAAQKSQITTTSNTKQTRPTITTKQTDQTKKMKIAKSKKRKKKPKSAKAKAHRKHTATPTTLTSKGTTEPLTSKSTNKENNTKNIYNEAKTTIVQSEVLVTETKSSDTKEDFNITDIVIDPLIEEEKPKTKPKYNLFHRIKTVTLGFLNNIGKGKTSVTEKVTRYLKSTNNAKEITTEANINLFTEAMNPDNPTIIIINNEETTHNVREVKSKFKDVLLSILDFESDKINEEKEKFKEESLEEKDVNNIDAIHTPQRFDIDYNMAVKLTTRAELVEHDIIKFLKNVVPKTVEISEPPNFTKISGYGVVKPGILERVAKKLNIKVTVKEGKTIGTSIPTMKLANQNETTTVEPDLTKHPTPSSEVYLAKQLYCSMNNTIMEVPLQMKLEGPNQGLKQQLKTPEPGAKERLHYVEETEPTRTDYSDPKRSDREIYMLKGSQKIPVIFKKNIKQEENSQRHKRGLQGVTESPKYTYHTPEFDSYIREENGVYRLKRKDADYTKIEEQATERSDKKSSVFKIYAQSNKFVKKQRRKRKRSNADSDTTSQRSSTKLQVQNLSTVLATITCVYVLLAIIASFINWVFGR